MKTLINSYDRDYNLNVSSTTKTIQERSSTNSSIIFNESEFSSNAKILNLLKEVGLLNDNWDGDGAKAPSSETIQLVKSIIIFMSKIGQPIYHLAPGPSGEIMLDFRSKNKSLEIIFYSNKWIYVTFSESEQPKQGIFNFNIFPELLSWLNKE